MLDDQAQAWNRGDLEGYMAGYLHSPELTFASGREQKTSPESYGTCSHLCASVAHESARSTPRVRWRIDGVAAALVDPPGDALHGDG